ncbi:MAG: ABC transporter permease subunit [Bdellovibrionales bacterium]|nr:ABC transporter permease subunit [Oligoflexia bacterium]
MMKWTARLWLLLFSSSSIFFHPFQDEIESHRLSKVLSFGYDAFGRDCLKLTLTAAFESFRTVIPLGLFCLGLSLLTAGLAVLNGEKIAFFLRAGLDTLSSLPGFLIALALSVFFPGTLFVFSVAALFLIFPWLTRFWESQILKMRTEEYVLAASALGANPIQIFTRHLLPDLLRMLLSVFPFLMTRLLLVETSLSFLGLSTSPRHETWGRLLYQGKDYLIEAPWILCMVGIPLCLTLFSFHLLTRTEQN